MIFELDRLEGPACSRCGCQDCFILEKPISSLDPRKQWWGGGRARCKHCGTVFSFKEVPTDKTPESDPDTVDYQTVECPDCGSNGRSVKTASTRGTLRYHTCKVCGKRFKSREKK